MDAKSSLLLVLMFVCSVAVAQGSAEETVTDFDGNVYKTVKIGNQVWMAENLRTTHYSDGTPVESFVMNQDEANAAIYGRLYRWDSALRGSWVPEGEPEAVQGVSPVGWHIPSDEEWKELIEHLGGEDVAGGKLKEAGFTALPTGWFDFTGEFKGFLEKTFLRSSTAPGAGGGYAWELNRSSASFVRVFLHPDDAIPVRCIKNK